MKLHSILEGVYLSSYANMGPEHLRAATDKAAMFMAPEYLYRPEDRPEDIVHLQPLDSAQSLSTLPNDPNRQLPSFAKAKIYYAFKVVPNTSFVNPEAGIDQKEDYTQALQDAIDVSHKPTRDAIKSANSLEDVEQILRKVQIAQVDRNMGQKSRDSAKESEGPIRTLRQAMVDNGFQTLDELEAYSRSAADYNDYKQKFLFHAAQSLARKIKNPQTVGEARMSTAILLRAVQNFRRVMGGNFDFIVYPESSKQFNLHMAEEFKSIYPNAQIVPLSKLAGSSTTIDADAIYDRASKLHNMAVSGQKMPARLNMDLERRSHVTSSKMYNIADLPPVENNETLKPADPRWVDWWSAQLAGKLEAAMRRAGDRPIVAKDLQMLGHDKRYLQMFSQPGVDCRDKSILVVDDNVAYGSTMEIIHDMLYKSRPRSIMLFTPFYMDNLTSVY